MNLSRSHILLWMALLVTTVPGGRGIHAQTIYTADADSRIWIEGRSNVNRFECSAREYEGEAEARTDTILVNSKSASNREINLTLRIKAESFECGRNRMNRDLNEALMSDRFPYIYFELGGAETLSEPEEPDGVYRLRVDGVLTIAGTSRDVSFATKGALLDDGRIWTRGKENILMSDFNITPPQGLFGLIKAEDELTVHFDIYSKQKVEP